MMHPRTSMLGETVVRTTSIIPKTPVRSATFPRLICMAADTYESQRRRDDMASSLSQMIPPRYFFSSDSLIARHSGSPQLGSAASTIECSHDLSTHFGSQKMGVQGACERRHLCSNSATR
jgi:hypothetical protein